MERILLQKLRIKSGWMNFREILPFPTFKTPMLEMFECMPVV